MMTPERWSEIKEIFAAVMDRSADERQSALIEACQGDTKLQAELRQLLAQHDEMGQFLDGDPPASASSLLNPGYLLAERYEIVVLLGSGGMGEVYEAKDKELGGKIALKVVHPQMSFDPATLDRFRREVQLARQVTHPNVCRVFDIGRHQQQGREIIFLTMELVRGETLSARLKRDGKIQSHEAFAIATQLCHALGAAHQAGILHRDFKCGNVMLIGSGEKVRAVVTDFGIARWMRSTNDSTALTSQGAIFGTPAYMSPEQIQGKELTVASDIYSLGLVLYEMVTGVRPFADESPWAEALKRLAENSVDPPGRLVPALSRSWSSTILLCLERDPVRRLGAAQQVLDALQSKKPPRVSHTGRWRLTVVGLAAVLLLLLAAILRAYLFSPVLPTTKHIAVLPFSFAGANSADQAAAYELAASLTSNLAHLQNSRNFIWIVPWKNVQERPINDEKHAASALGANLLVTGELQKQGVRLRLQMKVKDAATLKYLRNQVIEVPEENITSLEDLLLQRVCAMLEIQIPDGMLHHLPVDETTEPGAYEFYARGKGYLLRHDAENVDRAIALFKRALEKDPKFALAFADLAFAYAWKYSDTKNATWLDMASQSCSQAISLNNNLSPAHLALGMIQQDTGNLERAIREYETALQLDPANEEARNLLAFAYDKAGNTLEAEKLLKDALTRNRASWVSYDFLGVFYYNHSEYKQAEPLFREAIELAPDNPVAYSNLGGIYSAAGKYQEAEAMLRRVIAIKPTARAYSNLATVLREEGRYTDLAAMLQKAVELAPDDDNYWFNLGNAYALAKDQNKSRQAYEAATRTAMKALMINPNDGDLMVKLALYYATLGEKEKAQLALAQVKGPFASPGEALFRSSLAHEMIGQREQALRVIRSALLAGHPLGQIENAATFADLRSDPRYSKMIDSLGPAQRSDKWLH